MTALDIQSHSHPYRVVQCGNVAQALLEDMASATPFFLVDRKVAGLYRQQMAAAVPAGRAFLIDADETAKSYEQLVPVFNWLLESKCQRSSHLVVVGGGVLQDIGCFIASVLFRGIRWTLVPTTLLAQCDSCIGSKSSLNIGRFKNQLGTFYPPHEVRLAYEFLGTLGHPEMCSGLGEAIKIHLVDSEQSVSRLRARLERLQAERVEAPREDANDVTFRFEEARASGDRVLELKKLVPGYPETGPLLLPVSFLLRRGERIALWGPNGCGKTTLLKTMARVLPPISGSAAPPLLCGIELVSEAP